MKLLSQVLPISRMHSSNEQRLEAYKFRKNAYKRFPTVVFLIPIYK